MYDLVTSPTRQPPSSTVESRLQKSIARRGREKCASRAINVVKTNKEREKDRKRERERENWEEAWELNDPIVLNSLIGHDVDDEIYFATERIRR